MQWTSLREVCCTQKSSIFQVKLEQHLLFRPTHLLTSRGITAHVDSDSWTCTCNFCAEELPCGHVICVAQYMLGKVGDDMLDDEHIDKFFHKCFKMSSLVAAYSDPVAPATEVTLTKDASYSSVTPSIVESRSKKLNNRHTTRTEHMTQQTPTSSRPQRCSNCGKDTHTNRRSRPCPQGAMTEDDKKLFVAQNLKAERTRQSGFPAPQQHSAPYAFGVASSS